jgi:omega-amidase
LKEFLKISIVQADLFWLDKKKNIKLFNALIEKVDETDIVLLPEMFNTSFCPSEIKMAEAMNGDTVSWMRQLASEKKCSVV